MEKEEFVSTYPRLFHMAEDGCWPSVVRHGLRSTSALCDLFEVPAAQRLAIEERRRPKAVVLTHPEHGTVVIRDQRPFQEARLAGRLDGMSMAEFHRLLNGKVFFWASEARLRRLLSAGLYRDRAHTVITMSTARLIERHREAVTLSAINSGATNFVPPRRGQGTFLPVSDYPFEEWRRRRGRSAAVVEVAVDYAVPDVRSVALRAARWLPSGDRITLWEATG